MDKPLVTLVKECDSRNFQFDANKARQKAAIVAAVGALLAEAKSLRQTAEAIAQKPGNAVQIGSELAGISAALSHVLPARLRKTLVDYTEGWPVFRAAELKASGVLHEEVRLRFRELEATAMAMFMQNHPDWNLDQARLAVGERTSMDQLFPGVFMPLIGFIERWTNEASRSVSLCESEASGARRILAKIPPAEILSGDGLRRALMAVRLHDVPELIAHCE